jgi:hypothetical protein
VLAVEQVERRCGCNGTFAGQSMESSCIADATTDPLLAMRVHGSDSASACCHCGDVQRFVDDDAGYLGWLAANPRGFVLNGAQNPVAAHLVLHRAACGAIGGARAHGSAWTTHAKFCGHQNELEAFARDDLGKEPLPCRRCLRSLAADRRPDASLDRGQPTPASAGDEAPTADDDSAELVLTGPEAKAAWRRVRPWFWGFFALTAAALVSGWLLWHRSREQLTFLGGGVSALVLAGFIWRTGAFAFSYEGSGEDVTFRARRSPVPPGCVTPVLAAAGIFMILAATTTGIGSALAPVAAGGIVMWNFGQATWGLLLTIIWVGVGVAALFSHDGDDRAGGGCLLALFTVALLGNFLIARFTGWGRQEWNSYIQPFRDMWHLVGG